MCVCVLVHVLHLVEMRTLDRMKHKNKEKENNWVLAFQIVYQQTIEIKDILDNTLFILIKMEHAWIWNGMSASVQQCWSAEMRKWKGGMHGKQLPAASISRPKTEMSRFKWLAKFLSL